MTCEDCNDVLLDLARGLDLAPRIGEAAREHLTACAACAARLQQQTALTAGLRALAAADRMTEAPSSMEALLLDRFAVLTGKGIPVGRSIGSRRWLAIAAGLLVAVTAGVGWVARERAFTPRAETAPAAPSEFVPWPGAASLPTFESGQLVRMELPVSVLPALGFEQVPAAPDGRVTADLLVGQDGMVRAVRLAPNQGGQP